LDRGLYGSGHESFFFRTEGSGLYLGRLWRVRNARGVEVGRFDASLTHRVLLLARKEKRPAQDHGECDTEQHHDDALRVEDETLYPFAGAWGREEESDDDREENADEEVRTRTNPRPAPRLFALLFLGPITDPGDGRRRCARHGTVRFGGDRSLGRCGVNAR